jgi:hypothetical protein
MSNDNINKFDLTAAAGGPSNSGNMDDQIETKLLQVLVCSSFALLI